MFRKKIFFIYIWKLQWLPSAKENVHVFNIYKKQKTLRNVFIYKKQTLFKNPDNFRYILIYKKSDTLLYAIFHEIFEVSIYIQKAWHFVLRDIFIYKNPDTSQKARQFAVRFYIQNRDTLRFVIYHWIFEIRGGGGIFISKKQCIFR